MVELERDALVGRGPALPGLKDIGIRKGAFTFLLGVVVADVGWGAVEDGRGGDDEVGVGVVACEVVGGTDGPDVVDDADEVWSGCEVPVEDSWFWVVPGANLRKAARAAASRGADGMSWSCTLGRSPSGGARWGIGCSLPSEVAGTGAVRALGVLCGTSCCSGRSCGAAPSANLRSTQGCHTPAGP
jgi:hypothetical protein